MQQNKKDSRAGAFPQANGAQALKDAGEELPLGKKNFIIMGISLLLIIIGFALTSGSPSGLEEYNPDIFSARRIIVGPALCFVGFVLMAIAIIVKPKSK